MATAENVGVTSGGNWFKTKQLIDDVRVIEITDAATRPPQGEFKEQVVFTFRFLDKEYDDERDNEFRFSLDNNEVRQKYVNYFHNGNGRNEDIEPLRGVKNGLGEHGIVLCRGESTGKGNPPVMFRDATEDEAANMRVVEHDDDIPF